MLNKRIIQELSKEFNLPEYVIETVVKHPFKFQKEQMINGEFKPFRHPHFGVFAVKPYRLEIIKKAAEINKNKNKKKNQ